MVLHALALEHGQLRVRLEDGVVLHLRVNRLVEAAAGHEVLVVDVLLAEQVADPLLRRVDVLAELPDADRARRVGVVAAGRAGQTLVMIDTVGGDELLVAGDDVGADGVVDPARLALLQRLVVAGVRPRQHLGLHAVAVDLLVPLDHLGGLRRVDLDRLAVLVDFLGAVAPHDGRARRDRVEVLADGDADRVAHLLQLFADGVEVLPRVRRLEAGLLEEVLAIRREKDGVVLRHGAPHAVHVRGLVARADGLAVLLLEPAHEVGDVDELLLVQPGHVHAHLDEVVTRLALHLGGVLGGLLGRRDVVDLDLDAGVLGEARPELGQLLVRERGEVVPAEIADLTRLADGRRRARSQDAGETGGGGAEKATSRQHAEALL